MDGTVVVCQHVSINTEKKESSLFLEIEEVEKNGNRGIKGCGSERGRGEEDPPHPSSPSVQSGFILCPIAPAGANLSSFRFLAATSPQTRCLSIKHMA